MNRTGFAAPAAPTSRRIAVTDVAHGTAEQLARVARFRDLEQTQPEELDAVAFFLLGRVGTCEQRAELWEQLREGDCHRLWYLITEDWDDRDLDDLDDRDYFDGITAEQAERARYERTRTRLCDDIEQTIWLARYRAAEAARPTVVTP